MESTFPGDELIPPIVEGPDKKWFENAVGIDGRLEILEIPET